MTMVWLKDRNTGLSGLYPEHFATRFDTLEPVDSQEAVCVECMVYELPDIPVEEEDDGDRD